MVECHLPEGAMQGVDKEGQTQPAYLVDYSQVEVTPRLVD